MHIFFLDLDCAISNALYHIRLLHISVGLEKLLGI